MGWRVTKNLMGKCGKYKTKDGELKTNYVKAGSIWEDDQGGLMVVIDRTFNPAGLDFDSSKSSVTLSAFEPKEYGSSNQAKPVVKSQPDLVDDSSPF